MEEPGWEDLPRLGGAGRGQHPGLPGPHPGAVAQRGSCNTCQEATVFGTPSGAPHTYPPPQGQRPLTLGTWGHWLHFQGSFRAQCLPVGGALCELTQLAPPPCEAREAGAGVGGVARDTVVNALPTVEAGAQRQAHGGCRHRRSRAVIPPSTQTSKEWLCRPLAAKRPGLRKGAQCP